ncbi:MAG: 3-phosphoglycerate dehydrogenase family protein [Clostridia bacterium]|nr:3-phosphoglycerate dehydrogenase family protein [Clostridia bacterium]
MYNIKKLNEISPCALKELNENYNMSADVENPDGIMLRSFNMHEYEIGSNLLAVARAGAGVNNIPIQKMTEKGVAVFNTPGANANAVKELVIANMLLGSRKIVRAANWSQTLKGKEGVEKLVEKGKKEFIGGELKGKTLGVVGLGAIGRMVANAAIDLEMNVLGYDPYISVDGAWSLHRDVKHITNLDDLFKNADYITLHVPLTDTTKYAVRKETIAMMKTGTVIINCARGELVNNADIIDAVNKGKISRYVTDFPTEELLGIENIICIPHLGASTPEAEDNCAVMAAKELRDFIENGNVTNSVNFPQAHAPRTGDKRITILHENKATMIAQATSYLSANSINIESMLSSSRGELGYMILDVVGSLPSDAAEKLSAISGFIKVRVID